MTVKNLVTSIGENSDLTISASEHWVKKVLTLNWCNDQVIDLILTSVVVFVDNSKATSTLVTTQSIFSSGPDMTAFDEKLPNVLSVRSLMPNELFALP